MASKKLATNQQAVADSNHKVTASAELCTGKPEYPELSKLPLVLLFNNLHQLNMRFSDMDPGTTYTFKEICGDKYWNLLSEKEQRLEFFCMEFLIKYENVPFTIIGYNSDHTYLYQFK